MRRPNPLTASLAAGLLVGSALAGAPAAAQQVQVGNAATVVGDVKLSNAQIRSPRKIAVRQRLAWGDQVDTGKRSQLQILLLDRSSFGIGANSRVRIDRFVYDPNEGRSVVATFFKGALRFFSGRQEGTNSADINTPAGRIGIRGTALDLLVGEEAQEIAGDEDFVDNQRNLRSNKNEATLVILRGPGLATEGGLTVGQAEVEAAGVRVVLDRPGLAAYIPRNGAPPIGPFQISNAGLAKVQDQLAPEVARAADGNSFLETFLPIAGIVGAVAIGAALSDGGDDNDRTAGQPQPTQTAPGRGNTPTNNVPGKPPG